jgi:hypothetical protein
VFYTADENDEGIKQLATVSTVSWEEGNSEPFYTIKIGASEYSSTNFDLDIIRNMLSPMVEQHYIDKAAWQNSDKESEYNKEEARVKRVMQRAAAFRSSEQAQDEFKNANTDFNEALDTLITGSPGNSSALVQYQFRDAFNRKQAAEKKLNPRLILNPVPSVEDARLARMDVQRREEAAAMEAAAMEAAERKAAAKEAAAKEAAAKEAAAKEAAAREAAARTEDSELANDLAGRSEASWTVREMKAVLKKGGVSTEGPMEKEELLRLTRDLVAPLRKAAEKAQILAMETKAIKEELKELKVDIRGIVEKEDLVNTLIKARQNKQRGGSIRKINKLDQISTSKSKRTVKRNNLFSKKLKNTIKKHLPNK